VRRRSSIALGVALLVAVALPASTTLARFTDAAVSVGTLAADTLEAPTMVAAAGGSSVTLSWVPSADAYATGYAVYRSTTSGSGYVFVSSVTPGTAVSTTDSPGSGTWFYTLLTTFEGWSSAASNEASAVVSLATSTAYVPCVTTAADTSGAGDNNGYETNPSQACADDSVFAKDTNSGSGGTQSCGTGSTPSTNKDRHRFYGFALAIPAVVATIDGISLRTAG
jgi:fibronectin-binding autotransporter adhesin